MKSQRQDAHVRAWERFEREQKAPLREELAFLSGLLGEELERFQRIWDQLPLGERRLLMKQLHISAEEDVCLDFTAIFRIGLGDADAEIRVTSIEGLWEDEDVRLITPLINLLQGDETEAVRIAAAQSLARFVLLGELQKIRPRPFLQAYEALWGVHENEHASVEERRRALESLAYAGKPEVSDAIQRAYEGEEEIVRISAVFAMGRSADPRWSQIVRQELHSPAPEMRYEAARASGELALQEAVPDLIELAEDVDAEVQTAALWALGQIGGEKARRTLQRYRHAENAALREAARAALEELDFFHGDLDQFFGPPEAFSGESELEWEPEETWEGGSGEDEDGGWED